MTTMDIRKAILKRLDDLDLSKYDLVQAVKGTQGASERTVYDFLAGKTSLNSDALGRILDVLKLEIKPK